MIISDSNNSFPEQPSDYIIAIDSCDSLNIWISLNPFPIQIVFPLSSFFTISFLDAPAFSVGKVIISTPISLHFSFTVPYVSAVTIYTFNNFSVTPFISSPSTAIVPL